MIFCCCGNGKTRCIAGHWSQMLGQELIELRGKWLTDTGSCRIDIPHGEDVIWMFPVYSWGVPPAVRDFIRDIKLQADADTCHHMVVTMGDDSGLTDKMWRKLMAGRGWTSASAQGVIMPNTYTLMKGFDVDNPDVARHKLHQAMKALPSVADTIRSRKCVTSIHLGSFAWIKSRIIYPWFVKYAVTPHKFPAQDCIGCGRCVQVCPMDNITLNDSAPYSPTWGDRCAICLGCYNVCSRHAIEYSSATADKGQYHYIPDLAD